MADSDSHTGQMSDQSPERARMRELSRALTTLRLGIPLLDEVTSPADGRSAAQMQALHAAAMNAVLEVAVLAGPLIAAESETPATRDWENAEAHGRTAL